MNRISVFTYLTDNEQKTLNFMKLVFGVDFGDEISMSSYKIIKELAKFSLWQSEPVGHDNKRR